jgi:hypothetical protein
MKRLAVLFMALFLAVAPMGCAGGLFGSSGTSTTAPEVIVTTYESVALSLNTVKMYIKGQEVAGKLKGAELDAKVAQWEQARQLFLQAGDALKASIAATTPASQNERMQAYNSLLQKAAFEIGKMQGGR